MVNHALLIVQNPTDCHTYVPYILLGDIAFRFLQYIRNQSSFGQGADLGSKDFDIKMPREIEAQVYMDPAENQSDGSSSSSSSSEEEDEEGKKESVGDVTSHVTVCDINQAMLDVGKQRADGQGITSGIVSNSTLITLKQSLTFRDTHIETCTHTHTHTYTHTHTHMHALTPKKSGALLMRIVRR